MGKQEVTFRKPIKMILLIGTLFLMWQGAFAAMGGCGGGGCGGSGGSGITIPLTEIEAQDLIYLREEEKLARDIYRALYAQYGATIFANISQAEQCHTTRVKNLLDKYKIQDPVVDDTQGVFTNPVFTGYYTALLQKGSLSLKDALEVGVIVELMDIGDIDRMLLDTTHSDVQQVLSNLRAGSYNHLKAFNSWLASQ